MVMLFGAAVIAANNYNNQRNSEVQKFVSNRMRVFGL